MVGWIKKLIWIKKQMDGWMDKKNMDGWMDKKNEKKMDGWMDGLMEG